MIHGRVDTQQHVVVCPDRDSAVSLTALTPGAAVLCALQLEITIQGALRSSDAVVFIWVDVCSTCCMARERPRPVLLSRSSRCTAGEAAGSCALTAVGVQIFTSLSIPAAPPNSRSRCHGTPCDAHMGLPPQL